MALDGLDGLLQHKKHQQWESQLTLASKVLSPHAMASQEVWIAQLSAQSFNQGNEVKGNVMNSSLHPQVNGGTNLKVQPKSLLISMLRMYANTMSPNFTGSGAGVRGNLACPKAGLPFVSRPQVRCKIGRAHV